jgi:hypothetical protein
VERGIYGYEYVTFDGVCNHERGFCDCDFRKVHQKPRLNEQEHIEEVRYLQDLDINDNPIYAGSTMVSDDESLCGGGWELNITKIKSQVVELKGRKVNTPTIVGDEIWLRTTDPETGISTDGAPYFIDSSAKSYEFIIQPNDWVLISGKYVCSVSVSEIKVNSIIDVSLSMTEDQTQAAAERTAMMLAQVVVYQEAGNSTTIFLRASGEVPTIPLPIVVLIRNGGFVE